MLVQRTLVAVIVVNTSMYCMYTSMYYNRHVMPPGLHLTAVHSSTYDRVNELSEFKHFPQIT